MYSAGDTIVAIATPPGRGGLAVVRLSGPRAMDVARELAEGGAVLEPRRATLVKLSLAEKFESLRDEALLTSFPAPASYTGEDVVEISLHGSPLLAARVVSAAVGGGARLARAGEFTLRAFLNGRLDLAQAEAVQDLVSATTPAQARMAFDQLQGSLSERVSTIDRELFELAARLEASVDFPDEGYHFVDASEVASTLRGIEERIDALLAGSRRGRLLREGASVAIVGRTNVGKSTVFNRLAGGDRAIVTEIPGTTRDLVIESVSLDGVPATIVDTAGARETDDPVEREGVLRAERARNGADLVLLVLDGSSQLTPEDAALLRATASQRRVIVVNKIDLPQCWAVDSMLADGGEVRWPEDFCHGGEVVRLSALDGSGFEDLVRAITKELGTVGHGGAPESPLVSNVRHIELLNRARTSLRGALMALEEVGQIPEELILSELQATRSALEEVTGRRTTEDLLNEIFSRFCVGK